MYHIIGYQTNPITGETILSILCDTANDLPTSPVSDNGYGGEIGQGSKAVIIADGSSYLADSNRNWILQPNPNAWENVYTKPDIDSMITTIYQYMIYYHSVQESADGSITFYSFGGIVGNLTIYGNGEQIGTPTPENPVMPEFVGVRTANLFDKSKQVESIYVTESATRYGVEIPVPAGTYTVSGGTSVSFAKTKIGDVYGEAISLKAARVFTLASDGYMLIYSSTQATYDAAKDGIMLNLGSAALPYEPFGWAEKITCAGQTTPVYLGEVPTVRRIKKLVLDGTENWTFGSSTNIWIGSTGAKYSATADGIICSHFKPMYGGNTDGTCRFENYGRIAFHYEAVSNIDEWKAYLAAQYASGNPVTVWYVLDTPETGIVNEPLCKIGTYADELSSTDAGVSIPTVKGSNTLTVDTELKPSKIEISGE